MEVSFTGLNNIYVGNRNFVSREYKTLIPKSIKVEKDIVLRFRASLTDDKFGPDLTLFKNFLKRMRIYGKRNFLNTDKPNEVCLDVQYAVGRDREGEKAISGFILNGVEVPLSDNKDLVAFTYLAKFTKRIAEASKSENRKILANYANDIIHSTALTFIG